MIILDFQGEHQTQALIAWHLVRNLFFKLASLPHMQEV